MSFLHTEKISNDGTALIVLHGWNHNLDTLKPIAQHLTSIAQIHLVDLPGFGKSPIPNTVWDTFQYADRMIAYMDSKGILQADFLGHSFGGKIALCLAIRYPHRIRRLILLSASGLKRKRLLWERCRFTALRWCGKGIKFADKFTKRDFYGNFFINRFGSTDYKQAGALRPILVKTVNDDLSLQLPSIQASTLMLWGDQDTETPPEIAYRMHSLIPKSQLLIFPGKGHYLYEDCGSHLCSFYIKKFLLESDHA